MSPLRFDARSAAADDLDLDSVAAVIWTAGPRYLLQHRDDRNGVSFPNWWSLFGGALESGETPEDALRRELMEELEFPVNKFVALLSCTYELWFEGRKTRKAFFSIEMTRVEADKLVLHEGQGMAWLQFSEILSRANRIVPYDLGVIALHNSRVG